VRLYLCGVRGSRPAPGQPFVRYGGNTSCVAVSPDGGRPSLILDAGTGITRVGSLLDGHPFVGTILLGHLHWDHTQGLPFFGAADKPDARVRMLIPAQGDSEKVLARAMSPPHFPVGPKELRGDWTFGGAEPGTFDVEGLTVKALDIPHKGGRMLGYRISDGNATFTYMSDHWPIELGPGPEGYGAYHQAALELADGADVLLHDAQYTPEEFAARKHFGHTTPEYAVGLAREAGSKRLLLFHHEPSHSDDELDTLAQRWAGEGERGGPAVEVAREDMVIDVGVSADGSGRRS
jgi:ribonuclease BN (tRNA processing enzyme)